MLGLTTRTETVYTPGIGERTVTTTAPDGTYTVAVNCFGTNVSTTEYSAWSQPVRQTTFGYDSHGRLNTVTDARNGTTTTVWNDADLPASVTTPAPATGQPAQTTVTWYDKSLRATNTVQPDGASVFTDYYPNGLRKKLHGSRTYPVEYSYDPQGQMRTMTTWQNFANNSGAATTTWNYNPHRGWLDNKQYADGHGPSYAYAPAGRLSSRTWARGITATYTYNGAGDLTGVTYSDGSPAVSYSYDRRGRLSQISNPSFQILCAHNDAGILLSESYSGGPLSGLIVTNMFDQFLRRTNLSLFALGSSLLASTSYSFDSASRLDTVSDGTNSATYSYLDNSSLVGEIVFQHNGQTVMTTSKQWDYLNRLTSVSSVSSAQSVASFSYSYNSANQRTNALLADGAYWVYTYDQLGQVVSGRKFWSDNTPVSGQQFDYSFDDIGNRKTATRDFRQSSYSANALNQYTSRTVPGYVPVLGEANSNATVSLWADNGAYAQTTRHGEYYAGELPVNNTTNPIFVTITNLAVLNDGTNADIVTNIIGSTLFAESPEPFTYDADGNLTSDSLWTNTWNAENRRTVIESRPSVPPSARLREQWTHLPDGRWIERIVSTNNGTTFVPMLTNRFVWDGQVLLAILNHTNGLELAFMRGLDLSGTMQGAGGVGGLLAVRVGSCGPAGLANTVHFVANDGNGNVTALVGAATGEVTARYEYGPFAEPIRETGPMANVNPIGFSTQYRDDVTGDSKYLYRDLNWATGRWVSSDPIKEASFEGPLSDLHGTNQKSFKLPQITASLVKSGDDNNEYAFVLNDPIDSLDLLGLRCGCGLDVGDALMRARQDMIQRFKNLGSRKKKYAVCEPYILASEGLGPLITNPGAAARGAKGWDLYNMTWGWDQYMKGKNCGACSQTVTVNGRCYNAWDVNYFSFGVICDACGLGLVNVGKIVRNWKSLPTKWLDDADAAVAFAEFGYIGVSAPGYVSTKLDLTSKCNACTEKATGNLGSTWPDASATR